MARDGLAEFIIRQFQSLVRPEGDLELLGVEGGVARVLYRRGHNEECPECVMSAEDLRDPAGGLCREGTPYPGRATRKR